MAKKSKASGGHYLTDQERALQKSAEQEIDIPETAPYVEPTINKTAVSVEPQKVFTNPSD